METHHNIYTGRNQINNRFGLRVGFSSCSLLIGIMSKLHLPPQATGIITMRPIKDCRRSRALNGNGNDPPRGAAAIRACFRRGR